MARKKFGKDCALFSLLSNGDWRWKCYFTDVPGIKKDDCLFDVLLRFGIHVIPDYCTFMRLRMLDRIIEYRDHGSFIQINVHKIL